MKSYQRIDQKNISYNRYNYQNSSDNQKVKNEIISRTNYNQNKEIKRTIKPSISSSNCSSQNNKIHITPIKRNNSNSKINIIVPDYKNHINKQSINKNKYIVNIIDRRQNFLDYKNNLQQRNSSFSKFPQEQKIEHKALDKSYDRGKLHSQFIIDSKYNNNKNIITTNYKSIKVPISIQINNYENQKLNSERSNIYNNWKINSNDKERLSTDPKNNYNIYISDLSNRNTKNNNKEYENQQKRKIIKHNRIYSLKTGNTDDFNKIGNKLLGKNNANIYINRQENTKIYHNYVTNSIKVNNNNLNSHENKLKKSFDNTDRRKDNSLIINDKKNNNYFYESKNLKNSNNKQISKPYLNLYNSNYIKNTYDIKSSNNYTSSLNKINNNIKNNYLYKPDRQINEIKYDSKYKVTYDIGRGNYSRNKTPTRTNITNNIIEDNKYNLSNINKKQEENKNQNIIQYKININNHYNNRTTNININNNYKRSNDNVIKYSNVQGNYRRNNIVESKNINNKNLINQINSARLNGANQPSFSYSTTIKYNNPQRKLTDDTITKNKNNQYFINSSFNTETPNNFRNKKNTNLPKISNDNIKTNLYVNNPRSNQYNRENNSKN